MKPPITYFLLFLFIPLCVISQNGHFEGVIHYKFKWKATNPGVYLKSYKSYYGTSAIIYIQPGRYKQVYYHSKGYDFVQYDYKTNLYYYKFFGIDTLFYHDCSSTKFNYKLTKTAITEKVLGYTCRQLLVSNGKDVTEYYYTEELPLDPKYYANHKMSAYDQITDQTRGIYLMNVSSVDGVKVTFLANSISQKMVDDKTFDLPDLPLKKK